MNMPLVLLNRRRRGNVFTPSGLFALAEPGVWYDPSDLTTLFTDTAGTTPVTTPGQTVALALDKSKGLVLGSNIVADSSFDASTAWSLNTGASITGGQLVFSSVGSTLGASQTIGSYVGGRTYQIIVDVASVTAGAFRIRLGGGGDLISGINAAGVYTRLVVGESSTQIVAILAAGTTSGIINSISVRELPGFHATQATAASRPTYGIVPATGRRNLLTRTEEFNDAVWTKGSLTVTSNTTVAPDGTTTADTATPSTVSGSLQQTLTLAANTAHRLSVYLKAGTSSRTNIALFDNTGGNFEGQLYVDWTAGVPSQNSVIGNATGAVFTSVGDGWYRVSVTITTDAVNTSHRVFIYPDIVSGTGNILIWGAQLETGSSATAYQRVGSAFDVTEAGVASLSYLSFDGVDDFLVTPTITPGTDKAQVFAGVRANNTAGPRGFIANMNAGGFNSLSLIVPTAVANQISFVGYGDNPGGSFNLTESGLPANLSAVLSGLAEISTVNNSFRRNGTQVASGGVSGAGNFGPATLGIGQRTDNQGRFNGNLFSLIVRFGANLDANTITNTETWVNSKTGAF